MTTVVFYDNLGRAIQTLTDNHIDPTPDRTSSLLDFTGRTLETKQNLRTLQIQTRQSYEIGGRPKATCQKITNSLPTGEGWGGAEPIARLSYNDLGELSTKTLGCNLQTLDYTYNIKGWLNNINNPGTLVADKDLFGMTLNYDAIGNIIGQTYSNAKTNNTTNTAIIEARPVYNYAFAYDNLNRISSGILKNNADQSQVFALTGMSYDQNGNIKTLNRSFGTSPIDKLVYGYETGVSNRLSSVIDQAGLPNADTKGFFDAASSNYTYDPNGNLKTDSGKGIGNISYNFLNLPLQVTLQNNKTNKYIYDSDGNKLRYILGDGTTFDYISGAIYKNDTLEFIPTPEGRWTKAGYEYYLNDHLGNLRVSCTCDKTKGQLSSLQESHYDPWGVDLAKLGKASIPPNRFKYNGKEFEAETALNDFGWRRQDAVLGRFTTIDRFTEKYANMSGYQYGLNNPILNIDVKGDSAWAITNKWNDSFIQGFRTFVQKRADEIQKSGKNCTCEDFPITILIDYASQNQLPVSIKTEEKTFSASSNEFDSKEDFKKSVLMSAGAKDLQSNENTMDISKKDIKSGDMFLWTHSGGIAFHTQLITEVTQKSIHIKQGNSDFHLPRFSNNPNSIGYYGKPIETGYYSRSQGGYRNITKGRSSAADIYNNGSIQAKQWNFKSWK